MDWNAQVDREYAEKDGLKPEDLRFGQWPVSDVRIALPGEDLPREVGLVLTCHIPAATPQANRYDADGNALPDPVGMALAWVEFDLSDDKGNALHETNADHDHGNVVGFVAQESDLWKVLTPGKSLTVTLRATPKFYYLAKGGAARLDYANTADGYFVGLTVRSSACTLAMDQDGRIAIGDG